MARTLPAVALFGLGVVWSCSWDAYTGTSTLAKIGGACDGVLEDCADGGTCVANACRAHCETDDDCPSGARCLWVETASNCDGCGSMDISNGQGHSDNATVVGLCVDNASVTCSPDCSSSGGSGGGGGGSEFCCPLNSTCAPDGHCRNSCGTSAPACVSPESCLGAFCYGPTGHDSTASDGGAVPAALLYTAMNPSVVAADTPDAVDFVSWVTMGDNLYLASSTLTTAIPTEPGAITGLTASNGSMYWTSGSGVFGCTQATCGTTVNSMIDSAENATRVSATSSWVVWIDIGANEVQGCPLAGLSCGGGVVTFASNQQGMTDVATDGSAVYWIGTGQGPGVTSVFECELAASCSPKTLGAVSGAQWIALGGGNVFAAGMSSYACSTTGTTCKTIAGMTTGVQVNGVAADSRGVYAATGSGAFFCGQSCWMGTAGPRELGPIGSPANGIALSSAHVYWSESQGIYVAPKPGGG